MGTTKTSVSKNISIPRPLKAEIDKRLSVDGFGTVPRNAYSLLIQGLLQAWLDGRVMTEAETVLNEKL